MAHKYTKTILLLIFMMAATASFANTFSVSNTNDAGAGSLRQAILDANAHIGTDTVTFSTAGSITLASQISITDVVYINGYSAPGASAGSFAARSITVQVITPSPVGYGLIVSASNTIISGINFISMTNGSAGMVSIHYNAGASTTPVNTVWIWGCSFNTNLAGTATYTNAGGYGVSLYGNSSLGNSNTSGWIIGTNGDGVNDTNEGNQFSQPDPALGVNAFIEPIRLFNNDNFIVAGNYFGLKADGVTPLQTFTTSGVGLNYGIALTNCTGFRIGTDGNGVSDAIERNVFAGMRSAAIYINGNINGGVYFNDGNTQYTNRLVGNNQVNGNYFGTDASGMTAGSNTRNRTNVAFEGSGYNKIGDSTNLLKRNVMVNSALGNIFISGTKFYSGNPATAKYNVIANNYIGVLADGSTAAGNTGAGVYLNANNTGTAGDTGVYKTSVYKNIIANNTARGIDVRTSVNALLCFDNTFSQNSIYNNTGLGINLGNTGGTTTVNPNNGTLATPTTANLNRDMDYGVITLLGFGTNTLTVSGYVGNNPAGTTSFSGVANPVIEFFIADGSTGQAGNIISGDGKSVEHGEGKIYLGSLTADNNGLFSGTLDVTGKGVTSASQITNTATEMFATGSTSEFGANAAMVSISGTVFNDANGLTDNTINGTGINAGGSLYVVLYDNTTGKVAAYTAVNPDGTYTLNGLSGNNYSISVTTTLPALLQAAQPTLTPPSGMAYTGEGSTTAGDGTPNGAISLGVINTNQSGMNFGIDTAPVTNAVSQTISTPTGNAIAAGAITQTGSGTDAEDGIISNAGTIQITSLPTNATMLYNGVAVTAGQVIAGFNPALLSFTSITNGSSSVVFNYAIADAAGVFSTAPAAFSIDWPVALPVKLESFSAQAGNNCNVVLTWKTSEETDTYEFVAERSPDGINFSAAANVPARNTVNGGSYRVTITQSPGKAYYRLKIVNINGPHTYSTVVSISTSCLTAGNVTVYPNPVTEKLVIDRGNTNGKSAVAIYNAEGRIMYKSASGNAGQQTINTTSWSRGAYFIIVKNENGENENVFKIIKQ